MNGSLISLNELLIGDKLFEIPVYQRSYAWEEENLKDFWEDLYYPSRFEDFLRGLKYKIDGLQLMQYIVTSDADAIRIFETANDRGRPLNNLEKTKSFLMHTSYLGTNEGDGAVESKLKELNQRFSEMYRYSEDVSENEHIKQFGPDDIQRYHFINYISENSSDYSDYMDKLKNRIRNMLRENADECVEYVLAYAKDLEQTFHTVKNIAASHEKEDELGKLLGKIFMIGRLANIFPLLIASWLRFGEQSARMAKILKLFESFTFRVYAVGRYRSDTAISRLNGMAHKVHQNRLDYDALIDELKKINNDYRDDHRFEDDLRSKYFYHRWGHDIKYLLSEYEIYLRDKSREPLTLPQKEVLSSEYQVEHIWAQNPSDEPEYDDDTKSLHEQNVHRLGNLTITAKSWNSSMGNKPFEEKKLKYVDSSLRVQRELVGWDEWNNATICERENAIVEFALQRWSV